MIKFSSQLLKAMPKPESIINFKLRLISVLMVIIPSVIIIICVHYRLLDKNSGFGYFLYWLHDYRYLPFKGYTYYLYYPLSLFAWAVLIIFTLYWLFSFLTNLSFFRFLQVKSIQCTIRKISISYFFLSFLVIFHKLRCKQLLLKEIITHERELEINTFLAKVPEKINRENIDMLVHLTYLNIKILTLKNSTKSDNLKAILYCHQAIVQLYFSKIKNRTIKYLVKKINSNIDFASITYGESINAMENKFSITSIIDDLICLFDLIKEEKSEDDIIKNLVQSVNMRRNIMENWLRQLEYLKKNNIPSEFLIEVPDNNDFLPIAGKLIMGIAIHVAMIVDMPEIALTTLEAFELLAFKLNCIEHDINNEQIKNLSTFLKDIPGHDVYKLCGELQKKQLEQREQLWNKSFFYKDKLVALEAFELYKLKNLSLFQAAGPDFYTK